MPPTTDTRRYSELLNRELLSLPVAYRHFPTNVPVESVSLSFFFRPAFLQGGTEFYLLQTVSQSELATIIEHWESENAQRQMPSGRNYQGSLAIPEGFITNEVNVKRFKTVPLPADFRTIYRDGKSTADKGDEKWNHGEIYGVSVSERRMQVFYWTEVW